MGKPLVQAPEGRSAPPSLGRLRTPCPDEDEILAFATGEIGGDRRRAIVEHVDTCEACRELSAALARDDDVVAEARSRTAHPPDASLEAEEVAPVSRPFTDGEVVSDKFRLLEVLGRGAMGTVYRAKDAKLGTDVALKLFHRTDQQRAFERELKVGRRIQHPNVCRLYDAGLHDEIPYITMGLVEGETLADLIKRETLSLGEAVEILVGIAAGLAAVHAQGVVHRDLKPANVMIERKTGEPVLTDFGFAADLESKQSRRLVGTPSFWAPEQARGESPTRASDVYSFGVLAYRLLAGKDFSLSDARALDAVPRAYRGLIGRCLEPRPGDRFADAKEVATALDRARRTRVPVGVLAAVGAAAVAAVGFLAFGRISPPTPEPVVPVATAPSPAPTLPPSAASTPVSPGGAASTEPAAIATLSATSSEPPKTRPPPATTPARRHPPIAGSAPPKPSATPPPDDPLYRH